MVAGLLGLVGAGLLVAGWHAQQRAPSPTGTAARVGSPGASTAGGPGPAAAPAGIATHGPVLAGSTPTHLSIPGIGVSSSLLNLGLNPDRTVQVPPLTRDAPAGWYRYSPTPGQLGPSIILGHIDSARYGPGVFFKLGALHKGQTVSVTRADHTVAVFRIDLVAQYPKSHFPTDTVYGNTDHAALRLITCGGRFNASARSYDDNIVAFASLVSSHPA